MKERQTAYRNLEMERIIISPLEENKTSAPAII
jgi:hypothetical protein